MRKSVKRFSSRQTQSVREEFMRQHQWIFSTSSAKGPCPARAFFVSIDKKERTSKAFEPKAGNIIHSATPENVGPVVKGDLLSCRLEGLDR
jgi:hypothetical protein